jgi:hypothetical protein
VTDLPEPGDWLVLVKLAPVGYAGQPIQALGGVSMLKCQPFWSITVTWPVGGQATWVGLDCVRPATPEEVAAAQVGRADSL